MRRKALNKPNVDEYADPFRLEGEPGVSPPIPSITGNWAISSASKQPYLNNPSFSSPQIPSIPLARPMPKLNDHVRYSSDPNLPTILKQHQINPNRHENFGSFEQPGPMDRVPSNFFDEQPPPVASILGVHLTSYPQHVSASWDEYSSGAAVSSEVASSEDVYNTNQTWNAWVDSIPRQPLANDFNVQQDASIQNLQTQPQSWY
jgi:hypothetical protein